MTTRVIGSIDSLNISVHSADDGSPAVIMIESMLLSQVLTPKESGHLRGLLQDAEHSKAWHDAEWGCVSDYGGRGHIIQKPIGFVDIDQVRTQPALCGKVGKAAIIAGESRPGAWNTVRPAEVVAWRGIKSATGLTCAKCKEALNSA